MEAATAAPGLRAGRFRRPRPGRPGRGRTRLGAGRRRPRSGAPGPAEPRGGRRHPGPLRGGPPRAPGGGPDRLRTGRARAPARSEAASGRRSASGRRDAVHALCAVLRSRGRTLGVVTFLRGAGPARPSSGPDAAYAEDVAVRVAVGRWTWRRALGGLSRARGRPERRARWLSAEEDPVPVLRHDPAVPLVAAVDVPRAQQRRLDAAARPGTPRPRPSSACIRALVTTVDAGAKGASMPSCGQLRVAHRDLAVEHDVAVVLQERARDVPGPGALRRTPPT